MCHQKLIAFLFLLIIILASSCSSVNQEPIENTPGVSLPSTSPSPSPGPVEEILSYVPAEWIDQHPAELIGPIFYYLDFETMSRDLDLPDVTSEDSRQAKLPLITGISNQGLPFTPETIDPMSASSYSDWGWDIADVSQALFIPGMSVSIINGLFSKETVINALTGKDYSSVQSGEFVLFTDPAGMQCFAVSQNVILIAPSRSELERMIQQKSSTAANVGNLPHLRQLISLSDSPHGFILAPSGDLEAMAERLGPLPPPLANITDSRAYTYDWDFVIIAFRSIEGITQMDIGYLFPSDQDAAANLPIVRESLTTTPSFRYPSATWADLITLKLITDNGNLVVVQATTAGETFLGTSFNSNDYYGFLSARPLD